MKEAVRGRRLLVLGGDDLYFGFGRHKMAKRLDNSLVRLVFLY